MLVILVPLPPYTITRYNLVLKHMPSTEYINNDFLLLIIPNIELRYIWNFTMKCKNK